MIKQLRDETLATINESPAIIIVKRKAMKDDGDGNIIIDPFGVEVVSRYRVRISHESGSVQNLQENSAGLSTNFSFFVLTDWTCPLLEGDTFYFGGSGYRVGVVNTNRKFGDIYSSTAPLIEFTDTPQVPVAVSGVILVEEIDGTITLSWDAADNADTYRVYSDISETGTFDELEYSGSNRTVNVDDLVSGTTYWFKIYGVNDVGNGLATIISGTAV
jgi:hypothetical protein